jgi:hypothetical protein
VAVVVPLVETQEHREEHQDVLKELPVVADPLMLKLLIQAAEAAELEALAEMLIAPHNLLVVRGEVEQEFYQICYNKQ